MPAPDPIAHLFDPNGPVFFSGGATTLTEASVEADFELEVPDEDAVPSEDKSPDVFLLADSAEFALRYGSNVVLLSEPLKSTQDPREVFEQQTEDRGLGFVTTIGGSAARVVPAGEKPTVDGVGRPPGADRVTVIEMVRNDRLITAYQLDGSPDELIKMMATIEG
ncbi:MAG TPA: hypothetical protein VH989_03545 [Actinomycetota bacterium]